ncbi:hypothetical protein LJR039_004314 [Pseudorhodoferax sp. LjRoot39]|uniref:hypothetical protein n=1 Tax=Pseudorhodoferax sp. LjRoot39 TaxID=3342328 RepID=UPI003ECE5511
MNTIDLIIRDACECEVPAKHDTDTVELRVSDLRTILERNLSAVPAVPDALNLAGDAGLAHDQCRAVVHMALALAEVHVARALIIASGKVPTATERIGESSAALMEYLGDALSNMDAVEEEDDAWLDPIFEAAHARWPVPVPVPEAEKATPEGCGFAQVDLTDDEIDACVGNLGMAPYSVIAGPEEIRKFARKLLAAWAEAAAATSHPTPKE